MVILGSMQDSWPSAEHEEQRASPLPRVEDIPYAERGYDPERVREASSVGVIGPQTPSALRSPKSLLVTPAASMCRSSSAASRCPAM